MDLKMHLEMNLKLDLRVDLKLDVELEPARASPRTIQEHCRGIGVSHESPSCRFWRV